MNEIPFCRLILFVIILLIGIFWNFPTQAQIEHNYLIGPQATNCDSLDIPTTSLENAIQMIESANFRYHQQFSISRTYGVMKAKYYSCDGEKGFLIMKVDKKDLVYTKVPKSVWDELINAEDLNAYYKTRIINQYNVISK